MNKKKKSAPTRKKAPSYYEYELLKSRFRNIGLTADQYEARRKEAERAAGI